MLFIRKLHKWLGLVVGLQLMLWTVSGLMFALLDHHTVTAQHSTRTPEPAVLPRDFVAAEPTRWLGQSAGGETYEIRLMALLDQWLWRIDLEDRLEMRRVADGQLFALDEALVRRLAQAHYSGEGSLQDIAYQATSGLETRDAGAVWQARFDDPQRTTLYFAADDGRLVEARNSTWRVFDFFWMLHTMDYDGRDDFNNPLVITAATATLWLSLSGLLLLLRSFRRQDFNVLRLSRRG